MHLRNWLLLSCCLPFWAGAQDSLRLGDPWLAGLPAANQLELDSEGNVFLLDTEGGKCYKYLALADFDSLISLGGRSNRNEGLLHPRRLVIRNRQNLYVLDDVQRRILHLNPNLGLLGQLDFQQVEDPQQGIEEMFPVDFGLSSAGEYFLLNQFDNKVYKLNLFGEVETVFGGPDYGEGSFYEPGQLAVTANNKVFVSDTVAQELLVYNYFGIFSYRHLPEAPFYWQRFRLEGETLLLLSQRQLFLQHLPSGRSRHWYSRLEMLDALLWGETLLLLTETGIYRVNVGK